MYRLLCNRAHTRCIRNVLQNSYVGLQSDHSLIRSSCSRQLASMASKEEQTPAATDSDDTNGTLEQGQAKNSMPTLLYADVGINLTDPIYHGIYHDKNVHEDDLDDVMQRATGAGVHKLMVTGSSLEESKSAVKLASQKPGLCYATVGVHPCTAKQFDENPSGPDWMLQEIETLAEAAKKSGHAVAFGEIGLDYDRLFLTGKEQQLKYFEKQLEVAVRVQLPLFLHSRAASEDFERLLRPKLAQLPRSGLVHSFTGTVDEMRRLVDLGLTIGVNGCSLKTEENLAVVKEIPLDRLQVETDGPWCEMRASHASAKLLADGPPLPKSVKKEKFEKGLMVKGRNEPVSLPRVAHVIAKVKGLPVEKVAEAAWFNSIKMFRLGENM